MAKEEGEKVGRGQVDEVKEDKCRKLKARAYPGRKRERDMEGNRAGEVRT